MITDLRILISCRLPILFRASCRNQREAKNWDRQPSETEVYSRSRKRSKPIFTSSESTRKHLQQESASCSFPKRCSLGLDHFTLRPSLQQLKNKSVTRFYIKITWTTTIAAKIVSFGLFKTLTLILQQRLLELDFKTT